MGYFSGVNGLLWSANIDSENPDLRHLRLSWVFPWPFWEVITKMITKIPCVFLCVACVEGTQHLAMISMWM